MKIVVIFISIFLFYQNLFSLNLGLEITAGTYKNNSNSDNSHASIFGIRNNLYFTKNIALQLKYENLKSKLDDKDIQRYTTSVIYQVTSLYKNVVPFFLAGIGYENASRKSNFYNFGMGGKYYFTYSANILAQLDITKKIDKAYNYGFSLGLGYDFNKAPVNSIGKIDYKNVDINIMQKLSNQKDSDEIFLMPY